MDDYSLEIEYNFVRNGCVDWFEVKSQVSIDVYIVLLVDKSIGIVLNVIIYVLIDKRSTSSFVTFKRVVKKFPERYFSALKLDEEIE